MRIRSIAHALADRLHLSRSKKAERAPKPTPQPVDFIAQLPAELSYQIIGHLSPPDIARLKRVSRCYQAMASDDRSWNAALGPGKSERDWLAVASGNAPTRHGLTRILRGAEALDVDAMLTGRAQVRLSAAASDWLPRLHYVFADVRNELRTQSIALARQGKGKGYEDMARDITCLELRADIPPWPLEPNDTRLASEAVYTYKLVQLEYHSRYGDPARARDVASEALTWAAPIGASVEPIEAYVKRAISNEKALRPAHQMLASAWTFANVGDVLLAEHCLRQARELARSTGLPLRTVNTEGDGLMQVARRNHR